MPTNSAFNQYLVQAQVDAFRKAILALAEQQALPAEVLALALADTLGLAAAIQDRVEGARSIKDRLHAFCRRVEDVYEQYRNSKECR